MEGKIIALLEQYVRWFFGAGDINALRYMSTYTCQRLECVIESI